MLTSHFGTHSAGGDGAGAASCLHCWEASSAFKLASPRAQLFWVLTSEHSGRDVYDLGFIHSYSAFGVRSSWPVRLTNNPFVCFMLQDF